MWNEFSKSSLSKCDVMLVSSIFVFTSPSSCSSYGLFYTKHLLLALIRPKLSNKQLIHFIFCGWLSKKATLLAKNGTGKGLPRQRQHLQKVFTNSSFVTEAKWYNLWVRPNSISMAFKQSHLTLWYHLTLRMLPYSWRHFMKLIVEHRCGQIGFGRRRFF